MACIRTSAVESQAIVRLSDGADAARSGSRMQYQQRSKSNLPGSSDLHLVESVEYRLGDITQQRKES